jgi:hypothetical protein
LDESLPQAFEALFAQLPEKWIAMRPAHVKTVKEALAFHSGIRAIRVPLEKENTMTNEYKTELIEKLQEELERLKSAPKFCGEWTRTKQGESVEYEVEYFSDGKGYNWKFQYFPKPPTPVVEKKDEFEEFRKDFIKRHGDREMSVLELNRLEVYLREAWHAALQSKER